MVSYVLQLNPMKFNNMAINIKRVYYEINIFSTVNLLSLYPLLRRHCKPVTYETSIEFGQKNVNNGACSDSNSKFFFKLIITRIGTLIQWRKVPLSRDGIRIFKKFMLLFGNQNKSNKDKDLVSIISGVSSRQHVLVFIVIWLVIPVSGYEHQDMVSRGNHWIM